MCVAGTEALSVIPAGNSFNDDERCVAAGYDNGDLKMFDLRTLSLLWETHLPNGVCRLRYFEIG